MKRVNKETAQRKKQIADTVFRLRKEQIGIQRWIEFITSDAAYPVMPFDVDLMFPAKFTGFGVMMNVEQELSTNVKSEDAPTSNITEMANIMAERLNEWKVCF